MYSASYSCQIVMKLEIFSKIFRQITEYKILWKSVPWERNCPIRTDGWKNRQTWRS